MDLLQAFKRLLGNSDETTAVTDGGNDERPRYDNMPGRLFKKEFEETPNAVLLDVRTPAEFKSGAIEGALNIDFFSSAFASSVGSLDKSKTYFIYCRSGNRSAQACKMMYKMGYDVRNLMGGIGAW